ncbi:MAG TPA: Mur ligase family protein [Acidimicrobiales bacterium]|nr:Mur ligase family protein [Acidimicrobiales bacterium]
MDLAGALEFLDGHVNLELDPAPRAASMRLEVMRRLVELMGDPQTAYPVIHITGTNGKGSTARMVTALLIEMGLSVGTYTSPHLERVNERIAWNGQPMTDGALVDAIETVANVEVMLNRPPTHFEILTAAAYRWFADVAVDVAVVEVGLGGRWDATNVADGQVCVVTNVSLDHVETIGPTLVDIASEKAGIVKPDSHLVLGETSPELADIFRGAGPNQTWERDVDFACVSNELAHGGRLVDLQTPQGRYPEVLLPVHGRHQGDNAVVSLAAVEAFFGAPLDADVVTDAFAGVVLPGRLEVIARHPLCVLDGAHNPAGAVAAADAVAETFTVSGRILVVGMLRGRDPAEMLEALGADEARMVIACPPPSPRALPAEEVAAAAEGLGVTVEVAASVEEAVALGLGLAQLDELVLVTGSLYVVGAARAVLTGSSA